MNEQTTELLRELAAKLGTTAEHLWEVLVRQAPINFVANMLAITLWSVGLMVWWRVVNRKTHSKEEGECPAWVDEAAAAAWISLYLWAVVIALCAGFSMNTWAAQLLNPEYWALQQVLDALGSK